MRKQDRLARNVTKLPAGEVLVMSRLVDVWVLGRWASGSWRKLIKKCLGMELMSRVDVVSSQDLLDRTWIVW